MLLNVLRILVMVFLARQVLRLLRLVGGSERRDAKSGPGTVETRVRGYPAHVEPVDFGDVTDAEFEEVDEE